MCECNIIFFHFFWCFCLLIPSSPSLFYSVGEGIICIWWTRTKHVQCMQKSALWACCIVCCMQKLTLWACCKSCVLHVEIDSLGVLQKLCVACRNWCVILFVFLVHYLLQEDDDEDDSSSQIEQVKLTVSETDDPSLPALTFRTWTIGTLLCIFLSFVNQFFHFRTSPITISGLAGQIVSLYLGRFMASMLPHWEIRGLKINPGPFNIKVLYFFFFFFFCPFCFSSLLYQTHQSSCHHFCVHNTLLSSESKVFKLGFNVLTCGFLTYCKFALSWDYCSFTGDVDSVR